MTDPNKCSLSHHFGNPDESITPDQRRRFKEIVETEAQKLAGKSREKIMTELEKIKSNKKLKEEIGCLRSSLHEKIMAEIARLTKK